MSLDERIRQLSETIVQEVSGPIETALHRLLADVMTVAAADRDQAVQAAVAEAAATHEAALAAAREEHERVRANVEVQRTQWGEDHDAALASLRQQLSAEHEAAAEALRDQLGQEHETALAALRDQLAGEGGAGLAALRDQLTGEHEAADAALRASLASEHEAAIAALRQQLEHEREMALAAAGSDIERERQAALDALREELGRTHEAGLKAALKAAEEESARAHRADIDAVEARAASEREAAVQAVRDESASREDAAVSTARTAAETAAGVTLTAALGAAERGREDAEARAGQFERERDAALAEAASARQAVREADDRVLRSAALVHEADRERDLECSDRTLAAFRRLDAARSLSEVFALLADQAAAEIGRAAILTVIGDRLQGWEVRGLAGIDPASIIAPVEPGSIFGLAVGTGLPVSTVDAPLAIDAPGLSAALAVPPGRAGLAVPIAVGGRTVAILYADDGGDRVPDVPSSWPEIAEILARHAGHRLEVLTLSHASALAGRVQQSTRATGWPSVNGADGSPQADERHEEESARRYARLLISEIKLYNEPTVEQGRQHHDLLGRLGAEIERARRLYEDKIPEAVRQRVDCFDQEVVRTLAGGDPGLLGRT